MGKNKHAAHVDLDLHRKHWDDEEEVSLKLLFKRGHNDEFIAKGLRRSEYAITAKRKELGLRWKKPPLTYEQWIDLGRKACDFFYANPAGTVAQCEQLHGASVRDCIRWMSGEAPNEGTSKVLRSARPPQELVDRWSHRPHWHEATKEQQDIFVEEVQRANAPTNGLEGRLEQLEKSVTRLIEALGVES